MNNAVSYVWDVTVYFHDDDLNYSHMKPTA